MQGFRTQGRSLASANRAWLAKLLMLMGLVVLFGAHSQAGSDRAGQGAGIRLIMVEEKGCRYCKVWDAEIGGIYHKTSEGRFAPLKRVRRGAADLKGFNPVIYTPTFILVRSGDEVGRITGYPGKGYFFGELEVLLSAIGYFPGL